MALTLWVGVFFVLVVPLHHRGLITLPGAQTTGETGADGQSVARAPYCPLCSLWDANNGPPPADAPVGCAICHLKSNLELPGHWTPPETLVAALDYLLPPADQVRVVAVRHPVRLGGRAPPAA